MLVLALDTSTSCGSLALVKDERLQAELTLDSSTSYLNRLLAHIDHLLCETGHIIQAVNLIVVSRGPGNFTGLRLGLSTAKGLALAVGCPVVAINTLEALAANFPLADLPVCPVIDAKKNQVYAAIYKISSSGGRLIDGYLLLSPELLAAKIVQPTILTGPGLERYGHLLKEMLGSLAVLPPPECRHVRAGVMARLGLEQFRAGNIPELDTLIPFYLRPADAELKNPPVSAAPSGS